MRGISIRSMKLEQAVKKIRKFFHINKRLPNYQELANLLGFASKNASFKLAQKLIDAGYIEKDDTGKLIPKNLFSPLFLAGTIKAGLPMQADQDLSKITSLDDYLINRPEQTYMLRVSGDSMIEAGIHDNDIVLIEKINQPKNGDIVAAYIDDQWTLKYYQIEQGSPVLIPANSKYQKIYPKEKLTIAGKVISVIRKYEKFN